MDISNLTVPVAEEMVVGEIVRSGVSALISIEAYLKPEYFYREALGEVYSCAQQLNEAGLAIDAYTLSEELRRRNMYEAVGGISFLETIAKAVLNGQNIETYAKSIRDMAGRRTLISNLEKSIETAKRPDLDVSVIMAQTENLISEATEIVIDQDFDDIDDIMESFKERFMELGKYKDGITGIPSGLPELDNHTQGWQDSSLVIIAALTGNGKTALLLNILLNASRMKNYEGKPYHGAMFSVEMSNYELAERLVGIQTKIDTKRIQKPHTLTREELQKVDEATKYLSTLDIIISDKEALDINELITKVRKADKKKKIDFLLVDYLPLVDSSTEKKESRQAEVADVAKKLKRLARKMNIPVICAAQLNRGSDKRPDKRPQMEDLRESGRIGQEANLVLFLHRPENYDADEDLTGIAEIYSGKHRRGALFSEKVYFDTPTQTFKSLMSGTGNKIVERTQEYMDLI